MGDDVEPRTEPNVPPLPEFGHGVLGEEVLEPPLVPMQESAAHDSDATVRRSNHTRCLSRQMQESFDLNLVQVMGSIIMSDDDPISREQPLLAYAASSDPDILTLSKLMKAPDHVEFREAMLQEFDSHCGKKHWLFVLWSSLPCRTKVLQSVQAMQHKH